MKKNFLFLFLFTFFLFPFKTYALSFTDCNNVEHTVDSPALYRDYCYFNYYNDTYSDMLVVSNRNYIFCVLPKIGTTITYNIDHDYYEADPTSYTLIQSSNYGTPTVLQNTGIENTTESSMKYTTFNIALSDDPSFEFIQKNMDLQDVKTQYNCPTVNPDPDPDPEPEEPTVDPITKEDFYILLVMFSTLIWLIYFKWCFPMTKGRDLK